MHHWIIPLRPWISSGEFISKVETSMMKQTEWEHTGRTGTNIVASSATINETTARAPRTMSSSLSGLQTIMSVGRLSTLEVGEFCNVDPMKYHPVESPQHSSDLVHS